VALNCGARTIQALPRYQLEQEPPSGYLIKCAAKRSGTPRWRAGHYDVPYTSWPLHDVAARILLGHWPV